MVILGYYNTDKWCFSMVCACDFRIITIFFAKKLAKVPELTRKTDGQGSTFS